MDNFKIMKKTLTAVILISTFLIGSAFVNHDKLFEITKNIEIYTKVYQELNSNYVDELDPGKLMKIGIDAMVNSLDPYTRFYSENQIERYKFLTEGKYDGIGARAQKIGKYLTIIEPYEGHAAQLAGLKAGDKIISVAGQSAVDRPEDEIRALFRGAAGTELPVTVQSFGAEETHDVLLSRSEVNMPNVPYSGMVDEKVGYIVLTTFTQDAGRNIAKAYQALKQNNPALGGIILDLRDNGGGLLHEAVNICNLFVPQGTEVVITKGKVRERDKSYKTRNPILDGDIPLVVLINKSSASASEIVSGVIQDLDRGVIVGQRSFGKGLVQNTKSLGYNNNMKLTTAKYYIPSGRCIQGKEYKDGEPLDIPDSQRAIFYTTNGRPVLDGGGVTPDFPLNLEQKPAIIKALESQFLIFEFVNTYTMNLDSIGNAKDFRFTDYDAFTLFVQEQQFSYENDAEKALIQLKSKTEDFDESTQDLIQTLESTLMSQKSNDLEKYKDQIIRLIEQDIVSRYHYQNGKIQQRLDTDPELDAAIDLLLDQKKYESILKGKK
jgi:carboxyl-terminal processing protease